MTGITEEPTARRFTGEVEPIAVPSRRRRRRRKLPPGAPREKEYVSLKARLATYVILAPIAILFVAPFAWLISASFQPLSTIFSNPPTWVPDHPTIAGYK